MVWNSLEQFAGAKKNQAGESGQKLSEERMPTSIRSSPKKDLNIGICSAECQLHKLKGGPSTKWA